MGNPSDSRFDLRFGVICNLFYRDILGSKSVPRQIDLLDQFFPGLAVREPSQDDTVKAESDSAFYNDQLCIIIAPRKEDGTFRRISNSADSRRITQILGRLTGTAKGSPEKERAAASAMQKRMAADLCKDPDLLIHFRDLNAYRICSLTEDQCARFVDLTVEFINGVIDRRENQSSEERESEPFSIHDEVFDDVMNNVIYQWNLEGNEKHNDPDVPETDDLETTANAFTWLLLLSLLRNECGRLNAVYLSTFQSKSPYRPAAHVFEYTETDDPDLVGKEEDIYTGSDLDNRFPGVEWYCDRCGEYLNIQKGFDDHLPEWRCQKCGYLNRLSLDQIYDTDAAWQNGEDSINRESFTQALKERTSELLKENG